MPNLFLYPTHVRDLLASLRGAEPVGPAESAFPGCQGTPCVEGKRSTKQRCFQINAASAVGAELSSLQDTLSNEESIIPGAETRADSIVSNGVKT